MADNMVYRGTDGLRETIVIKRGGDGLLYIYDVVVTDLVQLASANAGLNVWANHLQDIGGQFTGHPHLRNIVGGFNMNRHLSLSRFPDNCLYCLRQCR